MPTYRTIAGAGGSVTLPEELCQRLRIAEGTPVEFFLTLDGQVHFHAITGTSQGLAGIVSEKRSPPISVREMDDAIAEHLAEDDERISRQSRDRQNAKGPSKPAAE